MIDILFIQPPFWGTVCPPLGLACLKAAANERGLSTRCMDLNIKLYQFADKRFKRFWQLAQGYNYCENPDDVFDFFQEYYAFIGAYLKEIVDMNPSQIWITVQNSSSLFTSLLIQALGNRFPIYLGGPQIWQFEEEGVDIMAAFPGIRGYMTGEGEPEFLLRGLIGKTNSGRIKDLDKLPTPDFSDFQLGEYDHVGFLPIYFSRGCINKCIFCSERGLLGGRFRSRSGRRVFEDVEKLVKEYPRAYFFQFHDSVSNGDVAELAVFCDLMIRSGLNKKIRWSMGNATIRKEMRKSFYEKLKKAGCSFIGYGLETPVPRLLKSIGKHASVGVDVEDVVREGHDAGIKISLNFMFGLPGETEGDFKSMLEFLEDNKDYIYQVNPALNMCAFFPGSEGYKNPEKYGLILGHTPISWSSSCNMYSMRYERFRKFVAKAKELKLRNFFGLVDLPSDPTSFNKLYYSDPMGMDLDKIPDGVWWYLRRTISCFHGLIKKNLIGELRRKYYLWRT